MARKLLRHLVTIVTPFALAGGLLFGVGLWRESADADWCRRAAAGGVVTGSAQPAPSVLEEVRAACAVHRQRQRVMFGAIWRDGGQETARCGFELGRLQLLGADPADRDAILERYGIGPSGFEPSDRRDQDRFLTACRAGGR